MAAPQLAQVAGLTCGRSAVWLRLLTGAAITWLVVSAVGSVVVCSFNSVSSISFFSFGIQQLIKKLDLISSANP